MNNTTYLSLAAKDALMGKLQEVYANNPTVTALLASWVEVTVNAAASTLTLSSEAISAESVVGQYTGSVTLPYTKKSLNALLPYPLVFSWDYPTTFAQVQTYLQETYGMVIEAGELAVTGNAVEGGLSGTDSISVVPNANTGFITFVAQATSGRFVEGSSFHLVCTAPQVPVALSTLLALSTPPSLDILTDH